MARRSTRWRRGRWIAAAGLLGAVFAPAGAPVRRAAADRLARLRNLGRDPVAPFLDAPCHQTSAADDQAPARAEVAR